MDDMGFSLWCLGVDMLTFLGLRGKLRQKKQDISEFWFKRIEFDGFEGFGGNKTALPTKSPLYY